jgi:replicative DNA helicase
MNEPRSLPHSDEAEQALIGALFLASEAWHEVSTVVDAVDFHRQAHRTIWTAIEAVFARGLEVDVVTVTEQLRAGGDLQAVGGLAYLAGLSSAVPTAANASYYAKIVADHSSRRRAIEAARQFEAACFSEVSDIDALLTHFESRVCGLQGSGGDTHAVFDQSTVMKSSWDRIADVAASPDALSGLPTGLRLLDDVTGGYGDGRLIVVAARPSMGKSAFAVNNAKFIATNLLRTNQSGLVLFCSLEMTKEELGVRMIADEADVVASDLERAKVGAKAMSRCVAAVAKLNHLPLRYMDAGDLTVSLIATRARRLHEDRPVRAVFVDYLQLVQAKTASNSDESRIASVSRSLKILAKELRCPVVALAQLNRSVEQRADKRPLLSDLRGSGSIEQDADQVLMLYRDDYYNPDSEMAGIAEVIVTKNRGGRTGTVQVHFDGPKMRFSNLA